MTEIVGYIDGRIADAAGGVGWLDAYAADDHGYGEFLAGIDTLVMGRATFDAVRALGSWPYGARPTCVLTHRPIGDPPPCVTAAAVDYTALRAHLAAAGARRAWLVGGGHVLTGALGVGALDSLRLFTMPLVLGAGAALFPAGTTAPVHGHLAENRVWASGAVESHYRFGDVPEVSAS